MSEESRKAGTGKKIMPFHISEEEMQDPQLDRFVQDSLIREADELEEELNRRPDLAGIEAPEGMFESIVSELKKRGVWEEDASEEASSEENIPGLEAAAPDETAAGEDTTGSEAAAPDETSSEENIPGLEAAAPNEAATGEDALAALYAQLSEEDREALAIGRQVVQKREARTERRRRRRKTLKIAGVVAAGIAVVFGVGMTSEANRRLVKKFWDGLMADFGFKVNTDYVGEEETVRSKSAEEIKAFEAIKEKTGVPTIDFGYLPEEMEYRGYEITDDLEAVLFYEYQDTMFYVTVTDANREGSYYYMYDEDAAFQESVENQNEIEIKIWEADIGIEEKAYIAEFECGDWRYILNGIVPLEEMENIAKGIMIL